MGNYKYDSAGKASGGLNERSYDYQGYVAY